MTTPDQMVIVDGVQYRPDEVPEGKQPDGDKGTVVTTKVARPANKARTAEDK